jgi:prepilin-type N-terminal cleavage/methylation domain-containing protein
MKKNKAFSLVELSVVILIIGILIAGITQSGRLIRQIKLSTARSVTASSDVSSIRDVTAWFEASTEGVFTDTTTPGNIDVENNATIKAWRDVNPQKSTGDKPTLTNLGSSGTEPKYISSGINGIPSVYFDGGDFLGSIVAPTMPLISLDKTYSMFSVFRTDLGAATARSIITQIGDETTNTAQTFASIGFLANGNPGFITGADGATSWVKNIAISDQTDYIVGALVDFTTPAAGPDGTSVKLYVNSLDPVVSGTGFASKTAWVSTDVLANKFSVGASVKGTTSDFFKGMISEVIIFDRKLKDEEAQSVMKYLRKKYNINN